jgi:hypothetical protein
MPFRLGRYGRQVAPLILMSIACRTATPTPQNPCEWGLHGVLLEFRACRASETPFPVIDGPVPPDAEVDARIAALGRDVGSVFLRVRTQATGPTRAALIASFLSDDASAEHHTVEHYEPPPDWPLGLNETSATGVPTEPPEWWAPGTHPASWDQHPDPFEPCTNYDARGNLVVDAGSDGILVHQWHKQWFFPKGGCGG